MTGNENQGAAVERIITRDTPTDDEREVAMNEAWGFRADTRPIQEKRNAQHWFDSGWRAALRAASAVTPEKRIGCNICGEELPDGEPHLCTAVTEQGSAEKPRCGGGLTHCRHDQWPPMHSMACPISKAAVTEQGENR